MQAVQTEDGRYAVYDEQTGLSALMDLAEAEARLDELTRQIETEDARLDDKRLLEWARTAFGGTWEGQRVLEAERERDRLSEQVAAMRTAPKAELGAAVQLVAANLEKLDGPMLDKAVNLVAANLDKLDKETLAVIAAVLKGQG